MLDALTQRLSNVVKTLRGHARLSDENVQEMLREVRLALLDADAGLPVVRDFIAKVKDKALGQEVVGSLTPGQALVGVVHQELVELMGGTNAGLDFATTPPAVILLAGLQGSGKTTSAGKLARLIRATTKKKVLLVSTDVYRPAAIDQLATLARSLETDLFPSDPSQKPVDIARAALDWARKHYHDVLIVDTAGRLGIDEAMMAEVRELHAAVKPIETLFVVDSMQGQDAVNVARAFNEALPLTGIVLTKLDGDARGGAALSVRHVTGKPIKFVGVSEKLDGLEAFHPERMASRILGMGDILSLVEEARAKVDEKEATRLAEKFKKGKEFDLEDFKAQLQQMKSMGGIASLADKLPMQITQMANTAPDLQEKALKRTEGIINAMTPAERRKPELLKASRKRRIAAGAGVQVQEVNRLLAQFENMQKMMKMMRGGNLGKMLRNMKGMFPGGAMRAALRTAFAVALMAAASASCQSPAPAPSSPPAPAQSAPPAAGGPLAPFGWFAELAGACWKGDHPGGDTSDTQCYLAQYERLIRGSIKISRGGRVVGEGDAVFAFLPAKGYVVFSQWGTGGSYSTGHVKIEGETLVFLNQNPDGTDMGMRSVWHRAGPDGFRVVRERKEESGWKEFLAVDYRRLPG